MTESPPLHAVLYQDADGTLRLGDRCTTRSCAINTVKPLDGTIVRGLAELDQTPGTALAFWKRHQAAAAQGATCEDCPLPNYPTDATRCLPCPRRAAPAVVVDEAMVARAARAIHKYEYGKKWSELPSVTQKALQEVARLAIAAALGHGVGRG